MPIEDVFNRNKLNEQKHRLAFAKDMATKFHDWVENINTEWYSNSESINKKSERILYTTEQLYDNFLNYIFEKTNNDIQEMINNKNKTK